MLADLHLPSDLPLLLHILGRSSRNDFMFGRIGVEEKNQ